MIEEWKSIEGYEGRYEISNFGRVKSLERFIGSNGGKRKLEEKILKKYLHYRGYHHVLLRRGEKDHRHKKFFIHRLVGMHFLLNPENKEVVNHIDRDKTNNHISNLEWATYSENTIHYYECKKMEENNIPVKKEEKQNDEIMAHALANF